MRRLPILGFTILLLGIVSCTKAPLEAPLVSAEVEAADPEVPLAEGGMGGAAPEDNPSPGGLTGVPGIDKAQELEIRILDARGTGKMGNSSLVPGKGTPLEPGQWLLTDAGSEYEMTLHSTLLPDGIVRLDGRTAFLVEPPPARTLPRFRVYGGHASFYLPNLPQGRLTVLTPAGPLITHGAVFTVTVSPDFQVLVTCREGEVYLTGSQNASALPGRVLVADRLGRGRAYTMTPNEAAVFSSRWLKVMNEEAAPIVKSLLPRRLAAWSAAASLRDIESMRFVALWFREAQSVLGSAVPGPETWSTVLAAPVHHSVWVAEAPSPGLLGELP